MPLSEPTADLADLLHHFKQLEDPRQARGIRHLLVDIVTISVLATLCGANTYSLTSTFATTNVKWLQQFLKLPHGIPSQDTFERVFEIIDPGCWQRLFLDWLDQLPLARLPDGEREVVALAGETSRGCGSPRRSQWAPLRSPGRA